MRYSLTEEQARLFAYIDHRLTETPVAPTLEEMRVHMGLKAKSGIHRLLTALEQRGWIERIPGAHRAVRIRGEREETGLPIWSAPGSA